MKVSLNWLTDYVDVTMSAMELAELFTRIGTPCESFEEVGEDIVFDLEVTSNRPDLLGHIGVARELSAASGAKFHPPVIPSLLTKGQAAELTSVEVQASDLCPRYTARVLRGVKVRPSPKWLVDRLEAVGLRGINNVVDVTNFILMEYSQPLHSFDFDKLAGRRIVVRRGKPGEKLVSIDQTVCTLDDTMLVIADAEKPVAIAGIMGGLDTEVGDKTTSVLIEAAQFDQRTTRRTARKLRLMSESNYRFERGVDPVRLDEASLRACQLILELAGGELAGGMVDACANPWQPPQVTLRTKRTDAILGVTTGPQRQAEILSHLGLSPKLDGEKIVCTAPSHRPDLTREIDLIEEIARLEGYARIPVADKVVHKVHTDAPAVKVRRMVGSAMTGAGFDESLTYAFIDEIDAKLFGFDRTVRVDEAVRKTTNTLRPTLLPSLLRAVKANQDTGVDEVSLFELSSVFPPGAPGALPNERVDVAMATTRDLRDLRGAMESAVERVTPSARLDLQTADITGLEAGAAATLLLDGEPVGVIGLASRDVLHHYGIERSVALGAIAFAALLKKAELTRAYQPIPRFPAMRRDLSVIVDDAMSWAKLAGAIESVAQPLRTGLEYVTTYRGPQAGAGRKSVTVTLVYRSPEGTLRSEQVDEQILQVVAALKRDLAAELRM